jgi:hypothetical protein
MFLHILYLSCLFCSVVVGFYSLKHLPPRKLYFFPFYLLAVFAQELVLSVTVFLHPSFSTGIFYNIYNPVNTLFFVWFYQQIPFNRQGRKITAILLVAFLTTVIYTFCFLQSLQVYNNYLSLAGGFLITLSGILFLFNYFKLDNPEQEKMWLPVLWITIGLVTFYPVVNISFALYKYLLTYEATLFGHKLYRVLPQLMSIFMYVCFARAFYLCRKRN